MAKLAVTAADKMRSLEAAHYKGGISDCAFRLLFVLYSEVDRATGITTLDHKELAQLCGRDVRTVQRLTSRLDKKGLIRTLRKEIGRSKNNGRPIFGGWGGKNRYDLTNCAVANVAKACAALKTNELDRSARRDRSTEETKLIDSPRPDTLSLSYPYKDPSDVEAELTPIEVWRAHLLSLIGADKMNAWFRELKISHIQEGICYLTIQSPVARTTIRSEYHDYLLKALQSQDSSITAIYVDLKK